MLQQQQHHQLLSRTSATMLTMHTCWNVQRLQYQLHGPADTSAVPPVCCDNTPPPRGPPLTFHPSLCVLRSMNTLPGSPGPYHLTHSTHQHTHRQTPCTTTHRICQLLIWTQEGKRRSCAVVHRHTQYQHLSADTRQQGQPHAHRPYRQPPHT